MSCQLDPAARARRTATASARSRARFTSIAGVAQLAERPVGVVAVGGGDGGAEGAVVHGVNRS